MKYFFTFWLLRVLVMVQNVEVKSNKFNAVLIVQAQIVHKTGLH
jgi:hypothetical protein